DSIENLKRRLAIYATLEEVLKTIDILLHPITPFITEHLYLLCFKKKESIFLEDWPTRKEYYINKDVEYAFDKLKQVVSITNAARMKAQLKRRWPLKNAYICINKNDVQALNSLRELLKTQMNVGDFKLIGMERVDIGAAILEMIDNDLPITIKISLKRANIAPKVKADIDIVQNEFANIDQVRFLLELKNRGEFVLSYNGKHVTINNDDIEIAYETSNGFVIAERENIFVFIPTVRDRELTTKGLVRDLARRLQSLRKHRCYNPTDMLDTAYVANLDDEVLELIKGMKGELAYLVRVKKVELMRDAKQGVKWVKDELDGKSISLSVE
ncbi:MAG: isoleucine--tRNA ligase, partial [Thaumarchaeota archaeon]|nr:isoleucine--tRNA ligase [Nitrososphaerota archaeon]